MASRWSSSAGRVNTPLPNLLSHPRLRQPLIDVLRCCHSARPVLCHCTGGVRSSADVLAEGPPDRPPKSLQLKLLRLEAGVGIGQKTPVFQGFFGETQPNPNVSETILFNLLVHVLVHVGPSRNRGSSGHTWLTPQSSFRVFEAIKLVRIRDQICRALI